MRAENDSTYLILRWVELNCLVEIILRKEHKPKPAPTVYTWLSKTSWHFPVQLRMYCLLWCMKSEICSSLLFHRYLLTVQFSSCSSWNLFNCCTKCSTIKTEYWIMCLSHYDLMTSGIFRLWAVCSNHSLNELEMCLCSSELFECKRHNLRSPLRDMVVGKIRGEWKKIGVGGKNNFPMFCVLSQNLCVLSQRYLRSLEKLCVLSQRYLRSLANMFAFSRETLRSLAKLLRSLANIFAFPRKTLAFSLPVQHFLFTLRLLRFRQLRTFIMEQFIELYFELGLKYKEIRAVLSTRHGFLRQRKTPEKDITRKRIVSTEKLLGLSGPCWFHQSSAAVLWATSWVQMDVHEMQRQGFACEKRGCAHGAEGIGSCRSFNEESQTPQTAQLLC